MIKVLFSEMANGLATGFVAIPSSLLDVSITDLKRKMWNKRHKNGIKWVLIT